MTAETRKKNIVDTITDTSLMVVAILAIPMNVIIYFALMESEYQLPRYIPPLLGLIAIILALFRKSIPLKIKIWTFISLLFSTACFNLLLGLIDLASLWFILAVIYTLFISEKNEALTVFILSFVAVFVVGTLMILKNTFIPLQYNFQNCQFACVAVRILHFLLIGSLVYYILNVFFSTIKENVQELEAKAHDLETVNATLKNEMREKKEIQQQMMDAVILTEEKERKRLASDLHDGLGPVLSAVNLYYQAYIDAPDTQSKNEIELKLKSIIGNAIIDVSRISHNISPHILEQYGLVTALDNFIKQIAVNGKIVFDVDFDDVKRFDLKKELTVYRTIAELIHNTVKHADATQIIVRMNIENDQLKLHYEDNGKGFDVRMQEENKIGMGLQNIRNRIHSIGGSLTIESSPNNGMKTDISIPYEMV